MSYSRTYRNSHGVGINGRNDRSEMGSDFRSETQQPEAVGGQGARQENAETSSKQQRMGGFTMFRPDEKKRAQLEQVAKKETEEANARREARRLRHIHETPRRVGGDAVNYSTAVMQKQKAVTTATNGLETQRKREKWQREKREVEEREHQERKAKARAQAERNEVLRTVRAQEMADRHREDHRWKNQEFLDRLEQGSRYNGY